MGVICCPDCKGAVSENAEKCIHCGAPLMEGIKRKIKLLTEEKNVLEKILEEENKKYLKKAQEIESVYCNRLIQLDKTKQSDKKVCITVSLVAILILVIHLCNPNGWLWLTVPLCLSVAGVCFDVINDPEKSDPTYYVKENTQIVKEKESKLEPVRKEYELAIQEVAEQIKVIRNKLDTYTHM